VRSATLIALALVLVGCGPNLAQQLHDFRRRASPPPILALARIEAREAGRQEIRPSGSDTSASGRTLISIGPSLLRATGVGIADDRLDPPRVTPRVDLLAALDSDGDGILFPFDNCSDMDEDVAVCDADEDGFGNRCDCDIGPDGGDGVCNTEDIDPFKDALVANDPVADTNCDGVANTTDIPLFKSLLNEPQRPGPSGLPCAGEPPCN
jgi:hypothetical protein